MGHTLNLIPDFTLFIQLGIFLATFLVLRTLVFKPFLKLQSLRRERTEGARAQAAQARETAAKLKQDYETLMRAEHKRIAQWTEEERRKIADEERTLIQIARAAASEELQVGRKKIAADVDQARLDLLPLVSEYSSQIASKLLGRKVVVTPSASSGKHTEREKAVPT